MYVQDNHDRVSPASRCRKNTEGASDGGVLTSLPVRHRTQTGYSDTLQFLEFEASNGDLSQMVHELKRYLEPMLKKVEQTFLSAHIHQTESSESCVRARHDSQPSPPLEKGRRYQLDHFRLHCGRRTSPPGPLSCEERGSRTKRCVNTRRADRNVCPTFTPASSTARQAFMRG